MFGGLYFGQTEFAAVPYVATLDLVPVPPDLSLDTSVTPTGGGGWSHRGPVKLPQRKAPGFKPPVFKKPNPYRW